MCKANRVLRISLCVFIMAAIFGCAVPGSSLRTEIYRPVIQPGKTFAEAANDFIKILHDVSKGGVPVKCVISNNKVEIFRQNDGQRVSSFYFYNLLNHTIVLGSDQTLFILLPDSARVNFAKNKLDEAKKAADALYVIQQDVKNYRDKLDRQLANFGPVAAQYRALGIKPKMSEEQRKLIVQANALTEQKQYYQAREKYRQAIALDRTSYPGAYFNLALLEAQMNLPFAAIAYMKQYLLLAPDAKDARSAQDKIYEWELVMAPALTGETATKVSTEPADAFLEVNVSDSGNSWVFLGRAPKEARFRRSDPKHKFCLIRTSKPGYATEETSYPFESLPKEVHIKLRKSDSGQDSHGYLGIRYQLVTEELAKSSGLQKAEGVLVLEVLKNSPSAQAGLENGDIILTFGGKEIRESIDLARMAASTPVGEVVDVNILRNGQARTVKVKISKLPN